MKNRKPFVLLLGVLGILLNSACSTRPVVKKPDILGWESRTMTLDYPESKTAVSLLFRIWEPSFRAEIEKLVIYLHFPNQPIEIILDSLRQKLKEGLKSGRGNTVIVVIQSQGSFPLPLLTENRELAPFLGVVEFIQNIEKNYDLSDEYRRHFIGEELAATEGLKFMELLPQYFSVLHIARPWLDGGDFLRQQYQVISKIGGFSSWNSSRGDNFLTVEKAYRNLSNLDLLWSQQLCLNYVFHHMPNTTPGLTWLPEDEALFLNRPLWNFPLAFSSQEKKEIEVLYYTESFDQENFLKETDGSIWRNLQDKFQLLEKRLPSGGSLFTTVFQDF
jgi:hypothetical protein